MLLLLVLKIFAPEVFLLAVEILTKVMVMINQAIDSLSTSRIAF